MQANTVLVTDKPPIIPNKFKDAFEETFKTERQCYESFASQVTRKVKIAKEQSNITAEFYTAFAHCINEDILYISDHVQFYTCEQERIGKLSYEQDTTEPLPRLTRRKNLQMLNYLIQINKDIMETKQYYTAYKGAINQNIEALNKQKTILEASKSKFIEQNKMMQDEAQKSILNINAILKTLFEKLEIKNKHFLEGKDFDEDLYLYAHKLIVLVSLLSNSIQSHHDAIFSQNGTLNEAKRIIQESHTSVHKCDTAFYTYVSNTVMPTLPSEYAAAQECAKQQFKEFAEARVNTLFQASSSYITTFEAQTYMKGEIKEKHVNIRAQSPLLLKPSYESAYAILQELQKENKIDQIIYSGEVDSSNPQKIYLIITKQKYAHIFKSANDMEPIQSFDMLTSNYKEIVDGIVLMSHDGKEREMKLNADDYAATQFITYCKKKN